MAQHTIKFHYWMEYTPESICNEHTAKLADARQACLGLMHSAKRYNKVEKYRYLNGFLRMIVKELALRDITPKES